MKALVTGPSGVVGANLLRELLDAGWVVRVLLRPGPPRRALAGLEVERIEGDVLDPESLPDAMDGVDIVFHTAARFAYGGVDAHELDAVAVAGTRNVVRAAARAGVDRIVLTSSSVVFGSSSGPTPRDETAPFTPEDASGYAMSKVRQERTAVETARSEGVDLVSVCPTLTVGGWDYRLAESNAIVVKYLNDPWRSTFAGGCNIVSARDVARGHRLVAERGQSGQAYILGSDNLEWSALHRTISELCGTYGPLFTASHTGAYMAAAWGEIASRFTGAPPALTRDEVRMMGRWYWYDSARARALGYDPVCTREALREAVAWLLRAGRVRREVEATLSFQAAPVR